MILHHQLIFWAPKNTFESVKELLKHKYELVAPTIADKERLERQLVWEDRQNIGRFRVNFNYGQKFMRKDVFGSGEVRYVERTDEGSQPNIMFRYWSQRLDELTINNDPMRSVYLDTYKLLKPVKVTGFNFAEVNLDQLLI